MSERLQTDEYIAIRAKLREADPDQHDRAIAQLTRRLIADGLARTETVVVFKEPDDA